MIECGKILNEITPIGVNAIFDKFRNILQEGQVNKRSQYIIEKLFKVRKNKFKECPIIVKELDILKEDEKITHEISFDKDELATKDDLQG
jgi:pre-mRNA-splicing factor CWC22